MESFLSPEQLATLLNVTIDYYERGSIVDQNIQNKPLLADMASATGSFPGNPKLEINWETRFDFTKAEHPYEGDQILTFVNPANVRRAHSFAANRHMGLTFSHDELARNGVKMVDSNSGLATRPHAKASAVKLHDLLDTKLSDLKEGQAQDRHAMLWGDGTDSRLSIPGVKYWIHDDPTVPMVVGGLDQGAIPGWRNRSKLGLVANKGNASEQVLITALQSEWRQLVRFRGAPTKAYCGSDYLEQLENELRARGSYTESGWAKSGSLDVSMNDVNFRGMRFIYDPHLDDIGEAKRHYWLNVGKDGLQVMYMNGEREAKHEPNRTPNRLSTYVSWTTTMGTRMKRRQNSGVYSIA